MKLSLLLLLTVLASAASAESPNELAITLDRSIVLEPGEPVRRMSVTSGDIVDAVAINQKEILLNGKAVGDTTLMLWNTRGVRTVYQLHVLADSAHLDAIRGELAAEVGLDVSLTVEGKAVFLRGTVKDPIASDRAAAIAGVLGKVINLLNVVVPPSDPQILLKVRFANVDRTASQQLGTSFSVGDTDGRFNTNLNNSSAAIASAGGASNVISLLYNNAHFNINAALQALEAKSLLQILAEPNLLTVSGKSASFLAGGEFPFPTIQGGAAGVGQITVQFKEFGIRLNFLPSITPHGAIRMTVSPEVSSLDYSHGLVVSGFTVPGLATRKVQTEVELESGQSFVIAGLLDNQVQEQLTKIPGLGNVPILGKLFQSRSITKNNTELLVVVTPVLVRPIPEGAALPTVPMPVQNLAVPPATLPEQPGSNVTGPVTPLVHVESLPNELMKRDDQSLMPPAPASPAPAPAQPGIPMLQPPPAAGAPTTGSH